MTEEDAFQMLFTARWNIPKACDVLGMAASEASWEQMKIRFAEWCKRQQKVY